MGFPCILPAPAREKARGRYFSHGGSQNVPGPAAAGKHRVANLEDIAYTGFVHEKQNDNVIKRRENKWTQLGEAQAYIRRLT